MNMPKRASWNHSRAARLDGAGWEPVCACRGTRRPAAAAHTRRTTGRRLFMMRAAYQKARASCSTSEQVQQRAVDEQLIAARLHRCEDADVGEAREVLGGGLPLRDARLDEVVDARVRLLEDDVHELAAVDLRRLLANGGPRRPHQLAHPAYPSRRPACGLFDGLQHVDDPRFPPLEGRDLEQPLIILGPRADDRAAQIENRLAQQFALDEQQQVQDSAGAAVPILEWMDGFELIVADGHADEGIEIVGR